MTARMLLILASASMFIAVAAGAFGAHGLKKILDAEMLVVWHTAVTYQIAHSLGMFAIALLMQKLAPGILGWAGTIMFAGIVIFSGSLYVLALTGTRILGAITPIGGAAFLLAWAMVGWAAYKSAP